MDIDCKRFALTRIGLIATWSVVAIVITGTTSSILRLGFSTQWFSSYGLMIMAKVLILGVIAVTASKIRNGIENEKLIKFEVTLLLVVLSLGSLLSRFTPIVEGEYQYDRVKELVGISMPLEPNLFRALL